MIIIIITSVVTCTESSRGTWRTLQDRDHSSCEFQPKSRIFSQSYDDGDKDDDKDDEDGVWRIYQEKIYL